MRIADRNLFIVDLDADLVIGVGNELNDMRLCNDLDSPMTTDIRTRHRKRASITAVTCQHDVTSALGRMLLMRGQHDRGSVEGHQLVLVNGAITCAKEHNVSF